MSSPTWLTNLIKQSHGVETFIRKIVASVPYSQRLGRAFWDWWSFYEVSQDWEFEQLQHYQLEQLNELLISLRLESRYYSEVLEEMPPSGFQSIDAYKASVPPLTRTIFRDRYEEIKNVRFDEMRKVPSATSGTTGSAMNFYHNRKDEDREWAAICHQWQRVGFDPARSIRAEFRGLTHENRLVEYFPHKNFIRCSIFNYSRSAVENYSDEIRTAGVTFLHGYPSALDLLALAVQKYNIKFPQPKAILLASEMVYDWQLSNIQSAFPNSKIYSHYGNSERTILAGWCEHRREYHNLPQYAIIEIEPDTGEVIGTNLFNSVNGFIRYRMTDTVIDVSHTPCPDCNRPYLPRLIRLGGRMGDYLYTSVNGWIAPAIVTYVFHKAKAIEDAQIIQDRPDEITIRFTPRSNSTPKTLELDFQLLRDGFAKLAGQEMRVVFEPVNEFARTPSGKFKWIISSLHEHQDHDVK
jgi:phenylacetate-CoA ligase